MALIDTTYFVGELALSQVQSGAGAAALQLIINNREAELMPRLLGENLYAAFQAGLQEDPVPQKWVDLLYGKTYTLSSGQMVRWPGFISGVDVLNPGSYIPGDIEIPITGDLIGATTYTNSFLSGKSFRVVQRGYGPLGSTVTINDDGFTLVSGVFEDDDVYFIQFINPVPLPVPSTVTPAATKQSLIANYVYWHYVRDNHSFTTGSGEKKSPVAINVPPDAKLVRAWNQMVEWNRKLYQFLDEKIADYPEANYITVDNSLFIKENTLNL